MWRLFRSFRRVWESRHLGVLDRVAVTSDFEAGAHHDGRQSLPGNHKGMNIHKGRAERGHVAQRDTRRRRRDESLATAAGALPRQATFLALEQRRAAAKPTARVAVTTGLTASR